MVFLIREDILPLLRKSGLCILEQAASKKTGDINGILFRTEMEKTSSEEEFWQIWEREQESVTWVVKVAILA